MQGHKEYQEKLFINFQLSSRVPEDNFYRCLKSVLDLSFVRNMTKEYYGKEGQKSIDPVVFFKLMLIGYIENYCSDRKIISNASMRMDMLYFLGYDIDEELPWHSTLSRTRKLYGNELFLEVFRKVLSLCVEKGMVSGSRQSVDSAFIPSSASMNSLVRKESLSYLQELSANEEDSDKKKREDNTKNNSINRRKKQYSMSNENWTSTTDPDSRLAKKGYKPLSLQYNVHISVDTSSHVICGVLADYADKRDSRSIVEILKQTGKSLSSNGILLKEVLADTNYSSGSVLRYFEDNHINAYIPNHGLYKPVKEGFVFLDQENCYVCPEGKKLQYKGIRKRSDSDNYINQYRTLKKDCDNCPQRTSCIGKKGYKSIEDTIDKPFYDRMHRRINSRRGWEMRKLRSSTVEPVLGSLIENNGMAKVKTKGIALAHKHALLAATAYNIKKLIKFVANRTKREEVMQRIEDINTSILALLKDNIKFVNKIYSYTEKRISYEMAYLA